MEKAPRLFDKAFILRQIPIFAGLNFFERRLVLDSFQIVEYKQSQQIYNQNDPADAFYCILSGRVAVYIEKSGKQQILEFLHRGKYFGFISLLTGDQHSVSTRAVNDTVIVKIDKKDFDSILRNIPRLAVDLSRMLSRRLKKKDIHEKTIFESTIVSVFSEDALLDQGQLYSLNLALSLSQETGKKIILLDILGESSLISDKLQINPEKGCISGNVVFNAKVITDNIQKKRSGMDVLRIFPSDKREIGAPFLIALLTMLVNDYHYCIVPLSDSSLKEPFKILVQSDDIHLIMSSDPRSYKKLSHSLFTSEEYKKGDFRKKIKPIIMEEHGVHGKGKKFDVVQDAELFSQPVFATLPWFDKNNGRLIEKDSKDIYSRAVRRISRQLGDVLIGLSLGSGAAMGMSHIGVLKVLERKRIPIDMVAGSSIGAMIAALWCCGYSAQEVEKIILDNKHKRYIFGFDDLVFPLRGLIRGRHIKRFLKKYIGNKTFYDTKLPLKIVACDCMSMQQVVFDSGRLIDAVLASISIPGVFSPYKIGGRYYIDGGILNPLPTDVLVSCGANKTISVNVLPSPEEMEKTNELLVEKSPSVKTRFPFINKIVNFSAKRFTRFLRPNIFDVIVSSVQVLEYLLAQFSSLGQSDVMLHPDVTDVSWKSFDAADELIARGEEAAARKIEEIIEITKPPF